MEIIKENQEQPMANTINVIGVNQILNSLYTHGTGIVNSVVNSTYQQLTKLLQKFVNILGDDYIKSVLKDQRTYWIKNKQQIKYHYPYTNAEEVLKQINSVSEQQYTSNLIEQIIKLIKQIGNAVALTRCIRTALMEYNSQNANLISMNSYEHFGKITEQIQLVPSEEGGNATNVSANLLSNTQNSFKDANKMFNDTVSMLKQTGENNKNYLSLLVTSYGDALSYEKMEGVELFAFFFPALTITFVEMLINARERIERNTKGVDQYFSDDGFIMGICYLNKLFRTDFLFDSLNWFPSVLQYFAKQKKIYEAKKNVSKGNDLDVSISGKRIMTYMDEFRMLYYTYSSAVVLFNE
jgi:WASH complex subunit 7